jgi:hypothetical protein
MKLPEWKKKTLREAIEVAFPTYSDIKMLCRHAFHLQLNKFAAENATHTEAVDELVERADDKEQIGELIRVAAEERPYLSELTELAWQWRLLSDLDARLTGLAAEYLAEVASCYVQARPDEWPRRFKQSPKSPIDYAWDLVDATFPYGDAKAKVPLLIFVQGLKKLFSDRRKALQDWESGAVRLLSEHLAVSEDGLQLGLKSSRRSPSKRDKAPWVTILVRRDGKEPKPYAVKGWLYSSDDPQGKELLGEREETFLMAAETDLPDCFSDLLDEAGRLYAGKGTIHVEVFLAEVLRQSDVDQWDRRPGMAGDEFKFPFGYHHPMVIRSLKRVSTISALNATIQRWRVISRRNGCASIVEHASDLPYAVYWLAQIPLTRNQFRELDDSKGVGCVLIGSPIHPEIAPRTLPEIDSILQTGVPIVIWVRRTPDSDPSKLRESLTGLIQKGSLRDLCDVVWRKRREEYGDEQPPEHLCRNISLLYDNPDRLPIELDPRRRMRGPIGRIVRLANCPALRADRPRGLSSAVKGSRKNVFPDC